MEYIIGASIISTLGYDIVYNNILKTMMRTTDNIFNLITNIHSINYNEEIKNLDLEFYIQTISLTLQYLISLVNEEISSNKIIDINNNQINNNQININNTNNQLNIYKYNKQKQFLIKNTINNIQDNLKVIENNLKYIHETIEYNNKLWFPYFFSRCIDRNVDRIKYEKKILDSRMNLFLKIILV